jgi:hypothetical protein
MRDRCQRKTNRVYDNYGGRGIKVCNRWQKFENFLVDMGPMPDGMELDRINVNGNHEPGNCRWATPYQQARNQCGNRMIEYQGHTQRLTDWAHELGIKKECLHYRIIKKRMPIPEAFTRPIMSSKESAHTKTKSIASTHRSCARTRC